MRQVGSAFVAWAADFFNSLTPGGQLTYLIVQLALFYGLIVLALLPWRFKAKVNSSSKFRRALNSRWLFSIFMIFLILVSRLPTVLFGFQNDDECLLIACAKALLEEPRLWVACDTSTAGPLSMAPFFLAHAVGLPVDVGVAKMVAAVIISGSCVFTFLTFDVLGGRSFARVFMLPLIGVVSTVMTTHWDFFSYNAEQVAILILTASLYVLARLFRKDTGAALYLWLGFLLGLIPFAKLQAVPLALLIALAGSVLLVARLQIKYLTWYIAAGTVPFFLFLMWIIAGGSMDAFWNNYLLANLSYTGEQMPEEVTLTGTLLFGWNLLTGAGEAAPYFFFCITVTLFSLFFLNFKTIGEKKREFIPVLFAIAYFATSLYCIGATHRSYLHYTFFGIMSVTLLGAAAQTLLIGSEKKISPLHLIPLFLGIIFFHSAFELSPPYFQYAARLKKYGTADHPAVIALLNQYTKTGDKIAIWGWNNRIYSDTDLITATRYPGTSGIIRDTNVKAYFLSTFIEDLRRNKPRIILDAINSTAWGYDKREFYGFERIPELRDFIFTHYEKASEIEDFRIYVRK